MARGSRIGKKVRRKRGIKWEGGRRIRSRWEGNQRGSSAFPAGKTKTGRGTHKKTIATVGN